MRSICHLFLSHGRSSEFDHPASVLSRLLVSSISRLASEAIAACSRGITAMPLLCLFAILHGLATRECRGRMDLHVVPRRRGIVGLHHRPRMSQVEYPAHRLTAAPEARVVCAACSIRIGFDCCSRVAISHRFSSIRCTRRPALRGSPFSRNGLRVSPGLKSTQFLKSANRGCAGNRYALLLRPPVSTPSMSDFLTKFDNLAPKYKEGARLNRSTIVKSRFAQAGRVAGICAVLQPRQTGDCAAGAGRARRAGYQSFSGYFPMACQNAPLEIVKRGRQNP
jgi:hypothetical protein